jgi:hypothetical protein
MTVIDESTLSLTSTLDTLLGHTASDLDPIKPLSGAPLTSNPKLSLSLDMSEEE